jgi:hypothetical protein
MKHTSREDPGFYNLLGLDRTKKLDAPDVLDGLNGSLMSEDLRSGSRTFVLELPPGYRGRTDAQVASLEFFLLRGDLSMNGESVGASGYVHVPQLCGGAELYSERGALALAFWNPNIPAFPYPYTRNHIVRPWEEPWVNSMPGAHGVMHKSLRKPDPTPHPVDEGMDGGPGGYIRFQYIEPCMLAADEHVHHECFEEIILLQGDCFLVNEGQMGIGSVVVHPQEWYHAPFASRSGALILVHTDAPMGFPWPPRPYPEADKLAKAYFDTAPWDIPTEHIPWDQHPIAAMQEASPVYQEWRKGPGVEWGDNDLGTRIPYMPGKQGTASNFRGSWTRKPCGCGTRKDEE